MNIRKTTLNPQAVMPPLRGYYSNAVRTDAGPLLFISGQLGVDKTGHLVGNGDVAAEARQALRNIELILDAYGASMNDLLKITVYVTDIGHLDRIEPVRSHYFPLDGPASAIVQIGALALGAQVEIEGIAAID